MKKTAPRMVEIRRSGPLRFQALALVPALAGFAFAANSVRGQNQSTAVAEIALDRAAGLMRVSAASVVPSPGFAVYPPFKVYQSSETGLWQDSGRSFPQQTDGLPTVAPFAFRPQGGWGWYQIESGKLNLDSMDLSSKLLDGADFSGASIRGATLQNASINGANLENADLRNADLQYANIRNGVRLAGALLAGANFSGASFVGTKLAGFDMSGLVAAGAYFTGDDASHANFSGSDLRAASFDGANLENADFRDADLRGTNLIRATGFDPNQAGIIFGNTTMPDGTIRNM